MGLKGLSRSNFESNWDPTPQDPQQWGGRGGGHRGGGYAPHQAGAMAPMMDHAVYSYNGMGARHAGMGIPHPSARYAGMGALGCANP